jgi:hypothetical protein
MTRKQVQAFILGVLVSTAWWIVAERFFELAE